MELEQAAVNPAACPAVAEWPETAVGAEAQSLCFDARGVRLLKRACGLREGRAAWRAVEGACEAERSSFAMRVVFEKERRRERVEELLERLNCDDVLEMRAMALEPLESLNVDAFRQVLKQCRSEPQPVVAFFSHVPPSAELVQFFAGLAPLQRIEVVQEGAVLRRSFSLVFTREEETCDNRFVLCNLRGVCAERLLPRPVGVFDRTCFCSVACLERTKAQPEEINCPQGEKCTGFSHAGLKLLQV